MPRFAARFLVPLSILALLPILSARPTAATPGNPNYCWAKWSTLLGGAGDFERVRVAVAPDGDLVVSMGTTDASWLAGVTGTVRSFGPGGGPGDIVVLRLSGDGTLVRWAAVIGGTGSDDGPGTNGALAVLPDNSIAMCGAASPGFPLLNTAEPGTTLRYKAFLLRLSADGDSLYFSTVIGGTDQVSEFYALDVDPAGRIIACGRTDAHDFQGTPGAYQTTPITGSRNAFIASFTWSGTILHSTLLTGPGGEEFLSIALDPVADDVVVAGYSSSSGLAGAASGYDLTMEGGSDGILARFNGTLSILERFSFIGRDGGGGPGGENIYAVALDTDGAPVAILNTPSTGALPIVPGSWSYLRGSRDPYVFKLTADWSAIEWGTYVGGTFSDAAYSLKRLPGGDWLVTGESDSLDHPLSVRLFGARRGAYVTRLSPANAEIHTVYGLGGNIGFGLALQSNGRIIVGGDVTAASVSSFPLVPPSLQTSYAGGAVDGFLLALDPDADCVEEVPATSPVALPIAAFVLAGLASVSLLRRRTA